MEYALISSGVVQNVIVAAPEFIAGIAQEWDHIERIDTPEEIALGVGIGWGWADGKFSPPTLPPSPPAPPPPEWEWYIDLGPFFDRFGPGKLDVLTSPDAGVKALLTDLQIRKWIDLKRADVAQGVQYISMAVPSVTPEIVHAILNTPVTDLENLALRKLYFGA